MNNKTTLGVAKEALTGYRFVEVNSADEGLDMADSAGAKALGVVVADHAAGKVAEVVIEGFVYVDFAETCEAFDDITTDANGRPSWPTPPATTSWGSTALCLWTAPWKTSPVGSAVACSCTPTKTCWSSDPL